jgi:uncharacterized protein YjbI with pentapeptide repeats
LTRIPRNPQFFAHYTRHLLVALTFAATLSAQSANPPYAGIVARVEALGGFAVRDANGAVVEVNLARTWATDADVERVASIDTVKLLDLSFTYVTDRGIEQLKRLQHLEDLRLDTAEFLTDAAMSHLRANRNLKHLVLRGVDITDVGMPHVAELTALRSLDMSHTMLGDVGLENLPSLTELEELKLGADLAGANLADANLARANLADAYLAGANLANAYLAHANLAEANLAGAYLEGANLAHADLVGANLAGANLAEANLAGAKSLLDCGTPHGWRIAIVSHEDGIRIAAGCRWFTFSAAVEHWKGRDDRKLMQPLLAHIKAAVEINGWKLEA